MKNILFVNFNKETKSPIYKRIGKKYNLNCKFVDFMSFSIKENKLYFDNIDIREYEYVFVGLLGKNLEMGLYLLNYLKDTKIKHCIYGGTKDIDNKIEEYRFLYTNKFPHIPTIISTDHKNISVLLKSNRFKFPVISKPIDGSQGRGVEKHKAVKTLKNSIKNSSVPLLIQPFIKNNGDYRIWIMKGEILGIIRRFSTNEKEFRSNISLGGNAEIADLPRNIKEQCIRIVKLLKLDFAGIDVIKDEKNGNYYFMEINRAPQYKGFMRTTKINIPEQIIKLIVKEVNNQD